MSSPGAPARKGGRYTLPLEGVEMDANDYWTHVGLVTVFFVAVVGPRLFSPGHAVNSLIYLVGSAIVITVATVARYRSDAASTSTAADQRVREERP